LARLRRGVAVVATPRRSPGTTSRRAVDDADVEVPQRGGDAQHDGVLVGQREPADVQHGRGVRGRQDDEGHLIESEEDVDDGLALREHPDARGDPLILHEHDTSGIVGAAVVHVPAECDREDRDRRLVSHGRDMDLTRLAGVGGRGLGPKASCGHYDHALF
jgi:hypothetical protein